MSLGDWRRENVNKLVRRLGQGIKTVKPNVKFGISPFGIYRPGQPPQSRGLDAYEALYADSKKWLASGWVDYLNPQLYWRIDQTAQSYPMLLEWWLENNPQNRHIYVGNNLGKLDGNKWTVQEINNQIEITRNSKDSLALGNVFFSMKAFSDNRQQIYDNFKSTTYNQPALVPAMPWQNGKPPAPPVSVVVQKVGNSNVLQWKNPADKNIRSWTLYQKNSDSWKLIKIINADTVQVPIGTGIYALCAVSIMAVESVGVFIEIAA